MNRKRLLFVGIAALGLLLVGLIAALLADGSTPRPTNDPASDLLPSQAVLGVNASDLKFTVDYPGIAPDGTLLFATNHDTALASAKPDGSGFQVLTPQQFRSLRSVAWSPDAGRAVLKDATGGTYLYTAASRDLQPLNQRIDNVVWAPDNVRFASTFQGKPQIFDLRTNRGEPLAGVNFGNRFTWSADGQKLAVFESTGEGASQNGGGLRVFDLRSGQAGEKLADDVVAAAWFPEGEHLLIATKDSGSRSVKVIGLDRTSQPVTGPAEFGTATRDGDRLLVTGRATGPDSDRVTANDALWEIKPDGSARQLANLERRAVAAQLADGQYFLATNVRLYRIDLGGSRG